ncbi:MAG TPA: glycosyltransferase family A protein, partial [Ohtaekwangia sp.]|uniref:glycosyltransferase family 2 protein n=1 Tax=Ohtaekwangia sp. TaxID=2066019 RepID=UPI002F9331AE
MMKITTVIPTRNRPAHIAKVLQMLQKQTRLSDEIIIVDTSDDKGYIQDINSQFNTLPLKWLHPEIASVCVQRNIGIRAASGDWIFLCDDDIEAKSDYLEKLEQYAIAHPACGAMAGRLLQLENGIWTDEYPVKGFADLLWRFTFQLSIWGDLDKVQMRFPGSIFLNPVKKFYRSRQNGLTLGGWPLITSWNSEVFQTTIYSLGANVIRRDWLLHSPYDEVLDPSGIGDNYGVAIGFAQA